MTYFGIVSASLLSMLACCPVAHATITIEYSQSSAVADDKVGVRHTIGDHSKTIPTNPDPLHLDAIDGESYSKNLFDWSTVGDQTILSFDSDLKRVGSRGALADFGMGDLVLFAHETTSYQMSGYLNVHDVAEAKSGIVQFYTRLIEHGSGTELFSAIQISHDTHDEQFTLGESGGDFENVFIGSLSGTLIAGHTYSLDLSAAIRTDNDFYPGDDDSGASAVSNFTLKIGTVPEPSAFALCSIFAALGLIRRRQIV